MPNVEIKVNDEVYQISPGLTKVSAIMEIANCKNKTIFLNREDDIDIPLLHMEYLMIRGGESFVTGDSSIEDNPRVRNEIRPKFNGAREISLSVAKHKSKDLKAHDEKFPNGRLFMDNEKGVDVEIPDDIVLVVQNSDSYFIIPPSDGTEDVIDVEECAKHDRRPPRSGKFRIRVDGEKHDVEEAKISGKIILGLVGKSLVDWSLNQKLAGGKRIKIDDMIVDLSEPGIERFETVRRQAQQGYA